MKDRKIYCMNNIARVGTDGFRPGYTLIDSMEEAAGVLVRSADMKDIRFPAGLRLLPVICIQREPKNPDSPCRIPESCMAESK